MCKYLQLRSRGKYTSNSPSQPPSRAVNGRKHSGRAKSLSKHDDVRDILSVCATLSATLSSSPAVQQKQERLEETKLNHFLRRYSQSYEFSPVKAFKKLFVILVKKRLLHPYAIHWFPCDGGHACFELIIAMCVFSLYIGHGCPHQWIHINCVFFKPFVFSPAMLTYWYACCLPPVFVFPFMSCLCYYCNLRHVYYTDTLW